MLKNLPAQKKQGVLLFSKKSSLILILMLGIFQSLNAQKIPYPLSKLSKNYKPAKTEGSVQKTNLSPVLSPTAGSWTALTSLSPNYNGGGMILLSDGTVLAKSSAGSGYGTIYNKLTPDASGSYLNGTWSSIAPMTNDRLYYSSQLLKDGRLYVAGGEYGNGGAHGEVYDPLTNTWTATPDPGITIYDANSEILNDGRVLQGFVFGTGLQTDIYDPSTNTYATGPNTVDYYDEAAWVKLPDNSILMVDVTFTGDDSSTERYIPATNTWIADAKAPNRLFDPYGYETGAAFLLPNGNAFFLGSLGHTAIYIPSGNTSNGTWVAGPDIPSAQGTPDAAAAMMVNGKILCAVSPIPTSGNHFPSPTSFYEYDYVANSFSQVGAPGGGFTNNIPSYVTNMLDLPDGNVLFANQGDRQYYIYTPNGAPVASGKPVITNYSSTSCSTFTLRGTGFNGISEGAGYGDDWQMETNYPIVRLTSGTNVYYCRTTNWNSTGVMRGNAPDSVTVTLPAGLPDGNYSMVVTANGIASNPITIGIKAGCSCPVPSGLFATNITANSATVNWASGGGTKFTLSYKSSSSSTWTVIKNIQDSFYNLTGLSLYTPYSYKVQTVCGPGINSVYSSIASFNTTYGGPAYCAINGATDFEYIDKVVLGSIKNTSGNNSGYGDFSGLNTNLVKGIATKLTLTPGFIGSPYDEYWDVYIDYNHDGKFKGADGERLVIGHGTAIVHKNIIVPVTALTGYTRMRILMHYAGHLAQTCGSFTDGEAEDYTVNIQGTGFAEASSVKEVSGVSSILVTPNPIKAYSATATLNMVKPGNASIKITDLTGRLLTMQDASNLHAGKNTIFLNGLSNLTSGIFIVVAEQNGIVIGRGQIVVNR